MTAATLPATGIAVHVVASVFDRPVEIQVRSRLQHLWAELSEKCSDVFDDPSIKYGGGSESVQGMLHGFSQLILEDEVEERSGRRPGRREMRWRRGFAE